MPLVLLCDRVIQKVAHREWLVTILSNVYSLAMYYVCPGDPDKQFKTLENKWGKDTTKSWYNDTL